MRVCFTVVVVLASACGRFGFSDTPGTGDGGGSAGGDSGDGAQVGDAGPALAGVVVRAQTYGGGGNEELYDVAVAPDGTVVGVGTTDGGTFMVGTDTITSAGGEDIFIASFAADGDPGWARRIGAAGSDRAQAVVIDSAGAIYTCGLFSGTVDFGGENGSSAGATDVFVASYTAAGTLRWLRTAGGVGADFCYALAVGPDGSIAASGYYTGAVDFGTGALPALGMTEMFVARYEGTVGTVLGARGFSSAGADSGQGVAVTGTGYIIATGYVGGGIDFGGGAVGTAGASAIVELDTTLGHVWSTGLAGGQSWDLDVHRPTNRIVVATRSVPGTDLGMGPLVAAGGNDALVVSFAANREIEWYRELGGSLSDITLGIAVDGNGTSYSIGLGGEGIDFGTGSGVVNGAGSQDAFVVAHAADGTPLWGRMFGGAPQDRGYAAAVAPDGGLYITGRCAGTVDFGTDTITATANDMFLVRLE